MKLLTKAITFASKKHQGQKRKGTDIPYIIHPLEALSIASTLTNDENVLAAAVLLTDIPKIIIFQKFHHICILVLESLAMA